MVGETYFRLINSLLLGGGSAVLAPSTSPFHPSTLPPLENASDETDF